MSNINCPYDGNFCRKMSVRFEHWQKIVSQDDGLFIQMQDPYVFSTCPILDEKERQAVCDRYRMHVIAENDTNTIRQGLAKTYEQR